MKPTVIIPVFNAYEHLQDCLASISNASPDIEVLLIDDASTDARIRPLLEKWTGRRHGRSWLKNERNRGFVFSVNRGISAVAGDVVLLNSDTVVTPNWLDALSDCLGSDPLIATATPWSNNGEIVSFPDFCRASAMPLNAAEIGQAIFAAGPGVYPELPTAVGFCMAVSRLALDKVGLFDEEAFGRGYGEENDFCRRAAAIGFRNVLCDNAYVAHFGGGSFAGLGMRPGADSMGRLLGKHPSYLALIEDFIRTDPLMEYRQALVNAVDSATSE